MLSERISNQTRLNYQGKTAAVFQKGLQINSLLQRTSIREEERWNERRKSDVHVYG